MADGLFGSGAARLGSRRRGGARTGTHRRSPHVEGTAVDDADSSGALTTRALTAYFFAFARIVACAAATRAMGTRNGEQET